MPKKRRRPKVTRHGGGSQKHKSHVKYKGKKGNKKGTPGQRAEKGKGGKKRPPNYKGKKGNKGKKKSGPKLPSIQDYLMGDTTYQQGLNDLAWALEQYKIENEAARGDAQSAFESAMQYMNLDKDKAHEFMKNDFGSRGLVFSGLYPDAVSDYNTEWSMGAADLNRDLASQLRDLQFEQTNMSQNTEMQKRDMRLDSIRRRAEDVQSKQFNYKSKPGGGGGGGGKDDPTRIERLQDKGLDKSQIVARLTGTKDNSGGASQLSPKQLRSIGFGKKYISRVTDRKSGTRKSGRR